MNRRRYMLLYYRSRFQIEFLYRDGKQHTGMGALTTLSSQARFSMSDIKTMNHNILMLNRFFDVFGISPYSAKNQNYVKELILYGTIAA